MGNSAEFQDASVNIERQSNTGNTKHVGEPSLDLRARVFERSADQRPEFRVAMFGLSYKFQRLLEIVLRHARHNQFHFVMAGSRAPDDYDIAIVDMTAKGGPEVASTLRRFTTTRPIVKLGRRADPTRAMDDLLHQQFTIQVLKVLDKCVDGLQQLRANAFANPPNAHPSTTAIKAPAGASAAPVALRPSRIRALVIDDSPSVRRQMALALHQMGVESEGVCSANEAMDVLAQRRYDLIFCDVVMPEKNGFQLSKAIKRDRALRDIPLIILTSRSSPLDLIRGALAGCNSYLVKPVSLKALRETVIKNLRRSSRFDIPLGPVKPASGQRSFA